MAYEIQHRFPTELIAQENGTLISLYQPTFRVFPDNKQDSIIFKKLLRTIENSLKQLEDASFTEKVLQPFYEIYEDREFWNHTTEGLAILASANKCVVFHLHIPVRELAVVADSFHIKPLVKAFQSIENYMLLGLSRENFALYQGNQYGIAELELDPDVPRTLEQVLGDQVTDSFLNHGSYGGASGTAMFHGHGCTSDEISKDTDKYFRYVDRYVYENFSKPSKEPLILFTLAEHQADFRNLSTNPYLLEAGISKSLESLSLNTLQSKVREINEERTSSSVQKLLDAFHQAQADQLGSSELKRVAKAAVAAKIETLLLEDGKVIPGKLDSESGEILSDDLGHPEVDDVLDDIAELVLLSGGSVQVLPKEAMPDTSGVAAIYRYR